MQRTLNAILACKRFPSTIHLAGSAHVMAEAYTTEHEHKSSLNISPLTIAYNTFAVQPSLRNVILSARHTQLLGLSRVL